MKRFLITSLCLWFAWTQAQVYAQGENNVWVFGHRNGLRFDNNIPVFFESSTFGIEGSAAVSDAAGNLLFYSNGRTIWNAAGVAMPNGSGLEGNGPATTTVFGIQGSSNQGVAIVKSLAGPGQYYVFTLDAQEDYTPAYTGYLRYSVVDMALNGGTGDVVAGQKDIVLDEHMGELMTIVKGAGCYYWLISHRNNSATYRAFKLDAMGIHPAVSSTVGSTGGLGQQMKVSFNGDRILYQNADIDGVEIGTFDKATGMVSNVVAVSHGQALHGYGSCFSTDDHKIYIAGLNGIVQYDISGYPNAAAIAATRQVISTDYYSQLRNGPDGKIYVASWNIPFIGTISSPGNTGMACNFNPAALAQPNWANFGLFGGTFFGHGLGSDVPVVDVQEPASSVTDTLICQLDTFRLQAPEGFGDYLWNDHTHDAFLDVTESGLYWVSGSNSCQQRVDSFHIRIVDFGAGLGPDTLLCPGSEIRFDVGTDNAVYEWQDGSREPSFHTAEAGTYSVTVTKDACVRSDTVTVGMVQPFLDIVRSDSVLCFGTVMQLRAETNPGAGYVWSDGSTDKNMMIDKGGTYGVTVTNACGTLSKSVTIPAQRCDCSLFVPNAFSPNGDGLNDVFTTQVACSPGNFILSIYNRFGQRVFVSALVGKGWDGSYNGQPAEAGVYFYDLSFYGPKGNRFEEKGAVTLLR